MLHLCQSCHESQSRPANRADGLDEAEPKRPAQERKKRQTNRLLRSRRLILAVKETFGENGEISAALETLPSKIPLIPSRRKYLYEKLLALPPGLEPRSTV